MNTIICYTSADEFMDVPMSETFARVMLDLTYGENVLYGRKYFEQDMQEQSMPGTKTYVLTRSHRFRDAKSISHPSDFPGGFIIGGRSTIASMMPYTDRIILGMSNEIVGTGVKFPSLDSYSLIEVIGNMDGSTVFTYKKTRFSK